VINSLRHETPPRLRKSGGHSGAILKGAGYSSVTVGERCDHPGNGSAATAFLRLEEFKKTAGRQLPASISAKEINANTGPGSQMAGKCQEIKEISIMRL